jgi:hypothetical protein
MTDKSDIPEWGDSLFPPLGAIQRFLFPEEPLAEEHFDMPITPPDAGSASAEFYERFTTYAERALAARAATTGVVEPLPGQVRLIAAFDGRANDSRSTRPAASLAVLLDAPVDADGTVWYGWVTSRFVQYAAHWDLLIRESDGPLDPRVELVQAWNPVRVVTTSFGPCLGQLDAERLDAVRLLAMDFAIGDDVDPARAVPGMTETRRLGEHDVETGTPYGDVASDPRCAYQQLYLDAAAPLCESAKEALARAVSPQHAAGARIELLERATDWCRGRIRGFLNSLTPVPLEPQLAMGNPGEEVLGQFSVPLRSLVGEDAVGRLPRGLEGSRLVTTLVRIPMGRSEHTVFLSRIVPFPEAVRGFELELEVTVGGTTVGPKVLSRRSSTAFALPGAVGEPTLSFKCRYG